MLGIVSTAMRIIRAPKHQYLPINTLVVVFLLAGIIYYGPKDLPGIDCSENMNIGEHQERPFVRYLLDQLVNGTGDVYHRQNSSHSGTMMLPMVG